MNSSPNLERKFYVAGETVVKNQLVSRPSDIHSLVAFGAKLSFRRNGSVRRFFFKLLNSQGHLTPSHQILSDFLQTKDNSKWNMNSHTASGSGCVVGFGGSFCCPQATKNGVAHV